MATSKKTEEGAAVAAARAERQGTPRERASERARAVAAEDKEEDEVEVEVEEASSVDAADRRSTMFLARATTAALRAITRDDCVDLVVADAAARGERKEARMVRENKDELEKSYREKYLRKNSTSSIHQRKAANILHSIFSSSINHFPLISNSTASALSPCRKASRP